MLLLRRIGELVAGRKKARRLVSGAPDPLPAPSVARPATARAVALAPLSVPDLQGPDGRGRHRRSPSRPVSRLWRSVGAGQRPLRANLGLRPLRPRPRAAGRPLLDRSRRIAAEVRETIAGHGAERERRT